MEDVLSMNASLGEDSSPYGKRLRRECKDYGGTDGSPASDANWLEASGPCDFPAFISAL